MAFCDCRRGVDDVSALPSGADEMLDFVGRCEATCSMMGSGVPWWLLGAFGMTGPGGADRPGEWLGYRWSSAHPLGDRVCVGLRRHTLRKSSKQVRMARVGRWTSGLSHQQACTPRQRRDLRDLWCLLRSIWSKGGVWCLVSFRSGFISRTQRKPTGFLVGFIRVLFGGSAALFAVCAGGGDPATRLLQLLFHSAINPEVSLQTEELGQDHIDRSALIS